MSDGLIKPNESKGSHAAAELWLMRVATVLTVIYAVAGLAVAVICDSITLLLDGLYGAADVIVSFLAIYAVRKIYSPPDRKYHYGYAKYEPLMTGIDGILILTICGATILTSVQDLVNRDPVKHLELAVGYSFVSIFICIGFGLYMRRAGRRYGSEVLVADSVLWIIEGVISFAVCVAFGLGLVLQKTSWSEYTDYMDPVMCILISLIFTAKPISILKDSFKDLVDASPGDELTNDLTRTIEASSVRYGLSSIESFKLRKAGRKLFLTLCMGVAEDRPITELDQIRELMTNELQQIHPEMDVFLTYNRKSSPSS